MTNINRLPLLLALVAYLGGCAGSDAVRKNVFKTGFPGKSRASSAGKVDAIPSPETGEVKISTPYKVMGHTYYPLATADGYSEVGVASWYGPDFHGKDTANGETYNQNSLTAAHKTLPFNTMVEVENLENGKSVTVRVNDRGPFVKNRLIDLSSKAATELGMHGQGTAMVRVTALHSGTRTATAGAEERPADWRRTDKYSWLGGSAAGTPPVGLPNENTGGGGGGGAAGNYYVQAGSFQEKVRAERLLEKLTSLGDMSISQKTLPGGQVYRVLLGPFSSREEAEAARKSVMDHPATDGAFIISNP